MVYYRLSKDIALENVIIINNGYISLDLNGHTLTGVVGTAIQVKAGATFFLEDSDGNGKIINGNVYLYGGSTFTMNGGKISDNAAASFGGGVWMLSGSTFTMNNGEISGNAVEYSGGGVFMVSSSGSNGYSTFTMNGGKITGNACTENTSASLGGGGVYLGSYCIFNMNNGEISGNTVSGNASGNGVMIYNGGTFNMSGGKITNNVTSNSGNVALGIYHTSKTTDYATFTIVEGYLDGKVVFSNGEKGTISISGGYLSETAYNSASSYIAEGYEAKETDDGIYHVTAK